MSDQKNIGRETYWRSVFQEHADSGLSIRQFCQMSESSTKAGLFAADLKSGRIRAQCHSCVDEGARFEDCDHRLLITDYRSLITDHSRPLIPFSKPIHRKSNQQTTARVSTNSRVAEREGLEFVRVGPVADFLVIWQRHWPGNIRHAKSEPLVAFHQFGSSAWTVLGLVLLLENHWTVRRR